MVVDFCLMAWAKVCPPVRLGARIDLPRGVILFALLLGGCSTYLDRVEKFRFLWKIGDAEGAAREMSVLAEQSPRRDLYQHVGAVHLYHDRHV